MYDNCGLSPAVRASPAGVVSTDRSLSGNPSDSPDVPDVTDVTGGESGVFPWTHDARARVPFSGRPAAGA